MRISSVLFLTVGALGHGNISFPPSRVSGHSCAHCANGAGVCGEGANSSWDSDPSLSDTYGRGFRQERVELQAGGKLEIEINITATHMGISVLELCTNPGQKITQDCFIRLKRDPTDNKLSPYLPEYPDILFMLEDRCMSYAKSGSQQPFKARFLIPDGINTSHAILRWYWQTGNSCAPLAVLDGNPKAGDNNAIKNAVLRDFRTDFWGAKGCSVGTHYWWGATCGEKCPHPSCIGERFANCADVAIVPGSGLVNSASFKMRNDDPRQGGNNNGGGGGGGSGGGQKPTTTTTTTTRRTTTTTRWNGGNGGGGGGNNNSRCPLFNGSRRLQSCLSMPPSSEEVLGCEASVRGQDEAKYGGFCRALCRKFNDATPFVEWCRLKYACTLPECIAAYHNGICAHA